MSQQVIASPEHLKRFAQQLKQFNTQLRDMKINLQGGFASLGETWRDQEHRKFAEEFVKTMRVLDQFIRTSDEYIPNLQRKAEQLQQYLNQR